MSKVELQCNQSESNQRAWVTLPSQGPDRFFAQPAIMINPLQATHALLSALALSMVVRVNANHESHNVVNELSDFL